MRSNASGIGIWKSDSSQTRLGSEASVDKNSPVIETLGAIAELNSWIGVFVALSISHDVKNALTLVQHDLFDLGVQISKPGTPLLSRAHVARIEDSFNRMNVDGGTLKEFILPGGTVSASFGHVARSVCWRAERRLLSLIEIDTFLETRTSSLESFGLPYLNRLSDLLLVASRVENRAAASGDVLQGLGKEPLLK
jgi:cob(I)alamin adenosyltransferase